MTQAQRGHTIFLCGASMALAAAPGGAAANIPVTEGECPMAADSGIAPSADSNGAAGVTGGGALLRPDDILRPAGPDERWTLLYTRSRCEKILGRACARLGIRHYLPLQPHSTFTGRRRVYALPLFPSYLFACLDEHARLDVLQTNVVVHVFRVDRPDVMLDELRQIRQALAAGAELTVGPELGRGDLVRVVRGPLAGLEGYVLMRRRRAGCPRLVLNVSILGQSAATEIDPFDVIRVAEGARAA